MTMPHNCARTRAARGLQLEVLRDDTLAEDIDMLFFTYHALVRMAQRGISYAWVLWTLANGGAYQQANGNWRFDALYNGGLNTMTVITDATGTIVVTTWWS
jgi:hypothetical protein